MKVSFSHFIISYITWNPSTGNGNTGNDNGVANGVANTGDNNGNKNGKGGKLSAPDNIRVHHYSTHHTSNDT